MDSDGLAVLKWLHRHAGAGAVFDSDVMMAFDWTLPHTQAVLSGLQAQGTLACRILPIDASHSFGFLALTRRGRRLLQARRLELPPEPVLLPA